MAIPNISEIRDGKRVITKKPELLLPAGNLEKLKIAIHYGADAVFLGGQEFGLRSNADNFTIEEIKEGCEFAAKYGADIYVTANIIAHDENFEGLDEFLMALQDAGVRGIIVADPYIIERCKAVAPKVEVHISTQQSISNYKEVRYWESEGVHRVVLARETGYEEIKEIREKTDVEIEMFVHGAMCIAYSGRCTLSNYMTARDSNRGGCCQSCRWNYDLYEEGTDEDTKLFDEGANPYAMSPKDLTLIEAVPEIIELGIDSLKVEGRMKSIHYVATVASVYRKLIDDYCADPDNFEMTPEYKLELYKCANRDTAMSFFYEIPKYSEQMFGNEGGKKTNYDFVGQVLHYDEETQIATIQQRNFFKTGQEVEFFGPEIDTFRQVIGEIYDEDGELLDAARHPLQITKRIIDELTQDKVALIEQDYYYKDQSHMTMDERVKTNYDHPSAFDNELLYNHLLELIEGKAVELPVYDYVNHTRSKEQKRQEPKDVIIIEGMFGLYSEKLRELMDIKIFVDTPSDLRILRRLLRDINERGRTVESVINQYLVSVRPMHEKYIKPTKQHADIIVPDGGYNDIAIDILITKIKSLLAK